MTWAEWVEGEELIMTISNKGKFIVIDGSDGSGKGTQSDILIANLREQGYDVAYYDFPQYEDTFFGKMTGQFLMGKFGPPEKFNPYIASLIYAGDRWQASKRMKKDLQDGKIVISNRYVSSSMGHQAGKFKNDKDRGEFLKWLQELEFSIYGIPKPDLVIYLYVPLEVTLQLLETKDSRNYIGKKDKDGVEKDVQYLTNSVNEYTRLAGEYPEWEKIDCSDKGGILPVEAISQKDKKTIKDRLEIQ